MFKVIELFNHKGGVSKTTTTFHLGWKLTELGKNVMLVDGDPQCNLTGLFFGDKFDSYFEEESTKYMNIKDGVSPSFSGKPFPIKAIECPHHINNEKLFLIPGHMDLSEYESPLSLALNANNSIITLQNLPGSFYRLIEECANKYNIDYVLIDLNPGLSSLNQTLFVYSDAFIVPTNPDPFSLMALKTLSKTLPRWKGWAVQTKNFFKESSYPLPDSNMKFLGVIIQRFNLRGGKAASPYQKKIDELRDYVNTDLLNQFRSGGMIEECGGGASIHFPEIPEFGALIQRSNESMVPVFSLTQEQMDSAGVVYENMEEKRILFDDIFTKIARYIINFA